jgi:hypothetical protein
MLRNADKTATAMNMRGDAICAIQLGFASPVVDRLLA